jgi:O-antigen/teichoic acid export membrane protein
MSQLVNKPYFSLKRAAMLNWMGFAMNFGLAMFMTPLILNTLGKDGFGIWALIQSLTGYYGLVNMGLGSAVNRFVNRDVAKGDLESLQMTLDAATVFFSATGILVLVLAWWFGKDVAGWLNVRELAPEAFAAVLMVACFAVVSDFFSVIPGAILNAAERVEVGVFIGLGRLVTQAIGAFTVLHIKPGIFELALVYTTTSIAAQILAQFLARKAIPGLRILPQGWYRARLGELLRYGSGTMLITISNLVRLRLGSVLIARSVGMVGVTNYTIATGLITNFSGIIASATKMLGVRFTKLHEAGSRDELHHTYRVSLFAISFITFGIGSAMMVFADRFLTLWLGREMPDTVLVLQVLTVAYVLALAQGPGSDMMFALAKHHAFAWVTAVECVVNLSLGIVWARSHGAIGFALATAVTMTASKICFQPWYAAKVCDISLKRYLSPMMMPAFCGSLIVILALSVDMVGWLRQGSILRFLGAALVFGITYTTLVLIFCRGQDYMPDGLRKFPRIKAFAN